MLPDSKIKCPAVAFKRSCRDIVVKCACPKFVNVKGRDPDGTVIDRWGCVDSFLPLLLIENVMASAQTGAAVESFRNEVVKANNEAVQERRMAINQVVQRVLG